MKINIAHFNHRTNKEIFENFRKNLGNNIVTNKIYPKKMTIDANDIDVSKFSDDQIKQLSELLQKSLGNQSKNSQEGSSSSSSNNSNDVLQLLLTDPDPLRQNCKSAKQRSIHPWSANLARFSPELMSGFDVSVDVSRASDFSIFQAVSAWITESKDKMSDHQRCVMQVIQSIYPDEFQLYQSSNKSLSLLAQVIFFIDNSFFDQGKCDETKIQEMINTFRSHRRFYRNNNQQYQQRQSFSGSRVRNPDQNAHRPRQTYKDSAPGFFNERIGLIPSGFCRPFNITGNCPYGSGCQYKHKCSKCFNHTKSEEGHAGADCSQF